jgi:multiple antibiotic resistance protein
LDSFSGFLKALLTLFAIVNPLGALPVFVMLTNRHSPAERAVIAGRAAATVTLALAGAALMGNAALRLFSISIDSFRVGGGILILILAIDMVNAQPSRSKGTPEESAEAEERADISVVPLGIPLMAGPGSISTVILYANGGWTMPKFASIMGIIALVGLSCWAALKLAGPIGARLGKTGIHALTRLMGLVLAALAIEFIAAGLRNLLPGLAR